MTQTKSTKTASDKKPKQPRCMTVAEIELSLKRLKNVPEECEQAVKDTEKDIKRAKKGMIISCIVFGAIAIYELVYFILGIVAQKADVVCFAFVTFIMELLFILYEIRDYQNHKNFIKMYIINRSMLAAWAKMTIEELNREVTLSLRVEELEGRRKNENTKKAKVSK